MQIEQHFREPTPISSLLGKSAAKSRCITSVSAGASVTDEEYADIEKLAEARGANVGE
jgi:hypothetical protein